MKKWYMSKTVWVNIIAIIGFAIQTIVGKEIITVDYQVMILAIINFILRIITKHELTK